MQIVPAILTNDIFELEDLLRKIRDSKKFERVQVDFIDGKYTNNQTVHPAKCDLIPYLPLKFDAHLMVTEESILNYSVTAQKMGFERIIAQVESISRPEEFTCLALDIHSPIETIEPYLSKLELVNLMSIEPGFGGQDLDLKILEKTSHLSHLRSLKNLKFKIAVDGGVEKEHLTKLENLGVDEVAVGALRVLSWK